jgi:hypothetical protein
LLPRRLCEMLRGMGPSVSDIEKSLLRLYVGAPGASLREEERRKALEVAALLGEIERALRRVAKSRELTLVDAAAGKAYVALLAAEHLLAPAQRPSRIVLIEREGARVDAAERAATLLSLPGITLETRRGDLSDRSLWPERPSIVVALHACGRVSDEVLEAAVAQEARHLLLVPCCTGSSVVAEREAQATAAKLGIPEQAAVRRSFVEAWIAAERTLRLEAAGYETEVVPFVPVSVTPYNLLWRSRRVGEPGRMRAARRQLARLRVSAAD